MASAREVGKTVAPFTNLSAEANHEVGLPERPLIGGRYQVSRILKSGQESETLLAKDLTLATPVVIKTAVVGSFSPAARMRLEHEAKVLAQIKNAPFPPLLDQGCEQDFIYLVMPFLEGVTLETRLRQGCLSAHDTLTVG